MFDNLITKSLEPIIDKKFNDENASAVFDEFTAAYPIDPGEARNIATITKEKDKKVYFCIVGLDYNNKITKIKAQWKLVDGVKLLLKQSKK